MELEEERDVVIAARLFLASCLAQQQQQVRVRLAIKSTGRKRQTNVVGFLQQNSLDPRATSVSTNNTAPPIFSMRQLCPAGPLLLLMPLLIFTQNWSLLLQ
jgi:hypothetical protein